MPFRHQNPEKQDEIGGRRSGAWHQHVYCRFAVNARTLLVALNQEATVNSEELAWGAFFYRLLTDYDSPYLRLFAQESLLAQPRQNPGPARHRLLTNEAILRRYGADALVRRAACKIWRRPMRHIAWRRQVSARGSVQGGLTRSGLPCSGDTAVRHCRRPGKRDNACVLGGHTSSR